MSETGVSCMSAIASTASWPQRARPITGLCNEVVRSVGCQLSELRDNPGTLTAIAVCVTNSRDKQSRIRNTSSGREQMLRRDKHVFP